MNRISRYLSHGLSCVTWTRAAAATAVFPFTILAWRVPSVAVGTSAPHQGSHACLQLATSRLPCAFSSRASLAHASSAAHCCQQSIPCAMLTAQRFGSSVARKKPAQATAKPAASGKRKRAPRAKHAAAGTTKRRKPLTKKNKALKRKKPTSPKGSHRAKTSAARKKGGGAAPKRKRGGANVRAKVAKGGKKRLSPHQVQTIKYNKRVEAIARLWKEQRAGVSATSSPNVPVQW